MSEPAIRRRPNRGILCPAITTQLPLPKVANATRSGDRSSGRLHCVWAETIVHPAEGGGCIVGPVKSRRGLVCGRRIWRTDWSDSLQPGPRPAGHGPRALRAKRGGYACKQRPAASWLAQKVWRWSFPAGIGTPFATKGLRKHGVVTAPMRDLVMGWIREIGISGQSERSHPMARISWRSL